MKIIIKIFTIMLTLTATVFSSSTVGEDTISSDIEWNSDTVLINSDITIDSGAILTISAGTRVLFTGRHNIDVKGAIKALGTVSETIVFSGADTSAGWNGIIHSFINPANDSIIYEYCRFQYGKTGGARSRGGALYFQNSKAARITSCEFLFNTASEGGAVYILDSDSIKIENCYFTKDSASTGAAISFSNSDNNILSECVFSECNSEFSGAVVSLSQSNILIRNCEIRESGDSRKTAGIELYGSSSDIINVLISGNKGHGIDLNGSSPRIINSTIAGNGEYGININTSNLEIS
ncbi:MAG: right-handed parallel beta-helix repeat-containing protein, partial [Fibrobacterota bacterium]